MDEWIDGPALACIGALGLWVVVNQLGVAFMWLEESEIKDIFGMIDKLHKKRKFDKVVELKAQRAARRYRPQIRGSEHERA